MAQRITYGINHLGICAGIEGGAIDVAAQADLMAIKTLYLGDIHAALGVQRMQRVRLSLHQTCGFSR